jgi:hypothetical protein
MTTRYHLTAQGAFRLLFLKVRFKVKVILRLAVYRQSVPLGANLLEANDQGFFFN